MYKCLKRLFLLWKSNCPTQTLKDWHQSFIIKEHIKHDTPNHHECLILDDMHWFPAKGGNFPGSANVQELNTVSRCTLGRHFVLNFSKVWNIKWHLLFNQGQKFHNQRFSSKTLWQKPCPPEINCISFCRRRGQTTSSYCYRQGTSQPEVVQILTSQIMSLAKIWKGIQRRKPWPHR